VRSIVADEGECCLNERRSKRIREKLVKRSQHVLCEPACCRIIGNWLIYGDEIDPEVTERGEGCSLAHYVSDYWRWTKACGAVSQRGEELESEFVKLLGRMRPTAELLAELPQRAAKQWEARKAQIAANARVLASRLADQETLNQRAIVAKLQREISQKNFETMKK
jgi:hypothetical protein